MQDTVALKPGSPTPSFTDLQDAVTQLVPLVESAADAAEAQTRQSDEVAAAFRTNGLYAILTPKALGGLELPFVEAMQLIEQVSHADGSAGWCMMVQGVMGASAGAFLSDEGARTVYPDSADVTVCGQGVPRGYATPVDGGYAIHGDWGYASGVYHAEWIHSGCFVMDGDEMKMNDHGHPEIILAHHPRDTIELTGNWDVLGLRATGSFDYTVVGGEVFVPAAQCYPFDGAVVQRGDQRYSTGLVGLTTWGHTGWALGVGRRALDELVQLTHERTDVFGPLHSRPSIQQAFADAEAKYRSARALIYNAWDDMAETHARGERETLEQVALIRLAMRHIHDVISEITTFAHRATRGASLRKSVLQRCYRDTHSGTQHILLADEILQACGKVLLGAASDNAAWNVLGLTDV